MAMSSYSNWDTLQNYMEMTHFQQRQAQLENENLDLLNYPNNLDHFPDTFLEPSCYDPDHHTFLYSDDYINHLLPYFSSPYDPLFPLSPEIFPCQDFDPCPCPKRQKCINDLNYSAFMPSPLDDFLPDFKMPEVNYCNGNVENAKKVNDKSLSAQSVAARERRRKITEKTQDLGHLIPGGHKMNTAEMLQAAFKYVKFLQAQVGILEFMNSVQEEGAEETLVKALAVLASPTVQEKLFMDEKCLVPIEFVKTLANHHHINSNNPSISNDLNQLISGRNADYLFLLPRSK